MVTRCVYLPLQLGCKGALANAQEMVAGIDPALNSLFGKIKAAAPSAKVLVFGYVQFWPSKDEPEQCQPSVKRPSTGQKSTMNSIVSDMNQKLATAAGRIGFTWVNVTDALSQVWPISAHSGGLGGLRHLTPRLHTACSWCFHIFLAMFAPIGTSPALRAGSTSSSYICVFHLVFL